MIYLYDTILILQYFFDKAFFTILLTTIYQKLTSKKFKANGIWLFGSKTTYTFLFLQVQFVTTRYSSPKEVAGEEKHLPTDDDDYISEDGSGSEAISSASLKEERFIYPLPFHCTQTISNRNHGVSSLTYILTS